MNEYCKCKYPIVTGIGYKEGDVPIKWDKYDICQQCTKYIKPKTIMSEFIPINGKIVVEPINEQGFVEEVNAKKEERGRVMRIYDSAPEFQPPFKVGDIVSFDAWLISKSPMGEKDENNQDKYRWIIKLEDIHGYESLPEKHL